MTSTESIPLSCASCDTFVVLPPSSQDCIIFGKNSDRPDGEVQEVIYVAAEDHDPSDKLQCTYIEIDQIAHTYSTILSKPAWMWGAEMGANEHGVCIGNEAVWTKLNGPDDDEERLLGMDLVRLGLERAKTAKEAIDVIALLLETYGQGGSCSESPAHWTYHNSFLIADCSEAWVLETAGKIWAAEKVTSGVRNISNCLSITTKIDCMSTGLKEHAQANNLWNPSDGEFDFAKAYGESMGCDRFENGKNLLEKYSASGNFNITNMFAVLRDSRSGICMGSGTTGSQVSILQPPGSVKPSCHWFTGTPDPRYSVFKPFIFCPNVRISQHIQSPIYPDNEDPVKVKPRFQKKVDRQHNLYKLHQKNYKKIQNKDKSSLELAKFLQGLEEKCVEDMEAFLNNFNSESLKEVEDLFKDVVESEMKFYK